MNKDIRVLLSFKGHRKRKRLKRLVGPEATDYLLDLWITAAFDRPDGVLEGWDEIDIADACGWDGEPEKIVTALIDSNWLEKHNGVFVLHDWTEHQGYCTGSKDRSDKAKVNALIKNYGRKEGLKRAGESGIDIERLGFASAGSTANSTAASKPVARCQHGVSTAAQHAPDPSPDPSPDPTKKKKDPDQPCGKDRSPPAGGGLPAEPDQKVHKNGKGGHWSERAGEWFDTIKANGTELARLSSKAKTGRRFNPWQMIQQLAKDRYHPGAIAEITEKLIKMHDQIRGNPYQYINAFRKTVKQNWNEKEAIAIHEEFKRMEPSVLFEYTKGLFGSL